MNFNELLKTAINASIEGGCAILKVYNSNFNIEKKNDNSPVTLADKRCDKILHKFLLKTKIPILSEEGEYVCFSKRKKWKYFWLIDPLDGTKEFIKRNGEFTVNIALIKNGFPVMGVVYAPVNNELYFALQGLGSYKTIISSQSNDLNNLVSKSLKLPDKSKRKNFIILGSRSHNSLETKKLYELHKKENKNTKIRYIGSSLKICMVAEGVADIYPRFSPTMEWDTGAGHAIAKMAGFKVFEYNTKKELKYNKEDLSNPWFIIS